MGQKINTSTTGNIQRGSLAQHSKRAHVSVAWVVWGSSADCVLHCRPGERVEGVGLSLLPFHNHTWNFDPLTFQLERRPWNRIKPQIPHPQSPTSSALRCIFSCWRGRFDKSFYPYLHWKALSLHFPVVLLPDGVFKLAKESNKKGEWTIAQADVPLEMQLWVSPWKQDWGRSASKTFSAIWSCKETLTVFICKESDGFITLVKISFLSFGVENKLSKMSL